MPRRNPEGGIPRVALVMVAVGDLGSSGGAERQFSDLHQYLRSQSDAVTLVTAESSLQRLRAAGRLSSDDGVVALRLGQYPARGKWSVVRMTLALLWVALRHRPEIVHLCLPTPSYVPFAAVLTHLPKRLRPRVVLNVIDCTLAYNLTSREPADLYERQVVDAHNLYFRWVRLDGVYSWYRAFADLCRTKRLTGPEALVRAARFCFTNPSRFMPAREKQQTILFAGRLSEQKRPLLFVEAVALLRAHYPKLVEGWRFEMYGGGVLEPRVRALIAERGLSSVVTLGHTPDLSSVFARSRVFVSTQAMENFTSLAMLEAMAAGNAVIAEDVGQTREFVKDSENGMLAADGTAEAFTEAIVRYLRVPTEHGRMAKVSRRLATEVHTIENFAEDITAFWRDVLTAAE